MKDNDAAFVPDGDQYVTARPLVVEISRIKGVHHNLLIPQGFRFDGASIPRVLWSLIGSPFEPDLMTAACVHDWYCEHTEDCYQSRVIGDAVFLYLLAESHVPRWRRILLYLGCRTYSFIRYGRRVK